MFAVRAPVRLGPHVLDETHPEEECPDGGDDTLEEGQLGLLLHGHVFLDSRLILVKSSALAFCKQSGAFVVALCSIASSVPSVMLGLQ